MNINIYYGGRGIIEDPTLFVLKKIENVFDELRVKYTRYNLFDMKNSITTLPQTMKDADGIILADCVFNSAANQLLNIKKSDFTPSESEICRFIS